MSTFTLESLLVNIDDCFWAFDWQTKQYLYLSPGTAAIFERPLEELAVGNELWQKWARVEDRQAVEEGMAQLFEKGHLSLEYRITTPHSRVKWVLDRRKLIRNEKGLPLRIEGTVKDISDRKQAEESLKNSEESYRFLFDHNPNPMWVFDLETLDFLEVNQTAIRKYGYSKDEFLAMKVTDIRPQDDVEGLQQEVKVTPDQYKAIGYWRHLKKDGTLIWVDISGHPLFFRGRKARLVLALDVTKKVEADLEIRKLNQSLAEFQYAINSASIVCITNAEGVITYVNDNFCEISQYEASELVGHTFRRINSSYHDKSFFRTMWKTLPKGNIWRGEIRNRKKDGTFFWVDTSIASFRDESDRIYQYLAAQTDITERREQEINIQQLNEELLASEEGLRQALDRTLALNEKISQNQARLTNAQKVAKLGYWEWDIQADKLSGSEEVYQMFGVNKLLFTNTFQGLVQIVHPDDRDTFEAAMRKALQETTHFSNEFRIMTPEGDVRHIQNIAEFETDRQLQPLRLNGTMQDITQRKMDEEKLKAQNEQLRQIAWISSHNIRRPVASILGLVSLFDKENPSNEFNTEIIGHLEKVTQELDVVIHKIIEKTFRMQ